MAPTLAAESWDDVLVAAAAAAARNCRYLQKCDATTWLYPYEYVEHPNVCTTTSMCKADIDKSCASDIPKAGEYLSGKVKESARARSYYPGCTVGCIVSTVLTVWLSNFCCTIVNL